MPKSTQPYSKTAGWNAICDQSGFKGDSSQFCIDPYGNRVLWRFADKPHAADNPKPIKPEQPVPWTRPEPTPVYVDGVLTKDDIGI